MIFFMWHRVFTQFEAGTEPPYSLACLKTPYVGIAIFNFCNVTYFQVKLVRIYKSEMVHSYMNGRTRKGESLFIYSRTHISWTRLEYSVLLQLYACDFGLRSAIFYAIVVRFYGCWWDLDGEKCYISEWSQTY